MFMFETMLNHGFIDEHQGLYSQLGFYLNSSGLINTFPPIVNLHEQSDDLKPINNIPSSFALDHSLFSLISPKPKEDLLLSSSSNNVTLPPLSSLQRSSSNLWACGEDSNNSQGRKRNGEDLQEVSALKMKNIKTRRKVREPRFCFKTMSDVDVLDDGYKWRKYGQKVVKNTLHPRSYYRCTQDKCRVKKRVERLAEDPRMVITTYEGRHVHSPNQDLDESQSSQPLLNNFFW